MIKEQTIEKILEATDLESVIQDCVPDIRFKRVGTKTMACCPFHNEKTPSFSVDKTKGVYHCFGCHASGNVITFLEEHEKMDY